MELHQGAAEAAAAEEGHQPRGPGAGGLHVLRRYPDSNATFPPVLSSSVFFKVLTLREQGDANNCHFFTAGVNGLVDFSWFYNQANFPPIDIPPGV